MLRVNSVFVSYDGVPVLRDISFRVSSEEIVALVGANGAGKTTLLRSISNLTRIQNGTSEFDNKRIDHRPPHEIVRLGISHVLEGRHLFGKLTVRDNLILGCYTKKASKTGDNSLEYVYGLFPILRERSNQRSETLSGGEQQMLAIARALMASPRLLMLDEPSLGLMPKFVDEVFNAIHRIKERGVTVLLVEQDIKRALKICDYGYVLQTGIIVLKGEGKELIESDLVRKAYLGM